MPSSYTILHRSKSKPTELVAYPKSRSDSSGRASTKTQISRFSLVFPALHCTTPHPKVLTFALKRFQAEVRVCVHCSNFAFLIKVSYSLTQLHYFILNSQVTKCDQSHYLISPTKKLYETKHGKHCSYFTDEEAENEECKVLAHGQPASCRQEGAGKDHLK